MSSGNGLSPSGEEVKHPDLFQSHHVRKRGEHGVYTIKKWCILAILFCLGIYLPYRVIQSHFDLVFHTACHSIIILLRVYRSLCSYCRRLICKWHCRDYYCSCLRNVGKLSNPAESNCLLQMKRTHKWLKALHKWSLPRKWKCCQIESSVFCT